MAHAVPSSPSWTPSSTRVFAFSVLSYPGEGSTWPRGPDDEFLETLRTRGVPGSNIVYLRDSEATREGVTTALTEHLASCTDPEETFIFYYCGHGSNSDESLSFCVYDHEESGSLPAALLFSLLERYYSGARALLFSDCCFSGMLTLEA